MEFLPTEIPGAFVIEPRVFDDDRGFFLETYHATKFAQAGIDATFVQDNHSHSAQGVLRGLHYQIEQPQGKLIRVVDGEIYDVAVDLRRSSEAFGRWTGVTLSAENRRLLYVPPGCAHGFYVVSNTADVIYKCTDLYAPQHERTLRWNDPDIKVEWPLDGEPVVSAKDRDGLPFADTECYP